MISNPTGGFWWSGASFALTNYNTLGWMVDINDLDLVSGPVWFDIPWLPV